ncbi:hypothetical protein ACIPLC_02495 [Kitasatospora sp. NPDC086801]|uniref:hypothetical protein n=1 Tax=Kitasatospora sp. NPDC086801 TaxID=3364066 RepID=UPI00381353D6
MTDILTLSFSAAAVLISIVAVFYSRGQTRAAVQQLQLAQQIRRDAAEPYVLADIVPQVGGSGLLLFRIENAGPTLARDVRLTISPPLQGGEKEEWDRRLARVVARTIPLLPPGRRIEWHFAFGPRLFANSDLPRQYTVTVNAVGPFGPTAPLTYTIDLDAIDASALERGTVEASLARIADQTLTLKDIPRAIGSVENVLKAPPAGPGASLASPEGVGAHEEPPAQQE